MVRWNVRSSSNPLRTLLHRNSATNTVASATSTATIVVAHARVAHQSTSVTPQSTSPAPITNSQIQPVKPPNISNIASPHVTNTSAVHSASVSLAPKRRFSIDNKSVDDEPNSVKDIKDASYCRPSNFSSGRTSYNSSTNSALFFSSPSLITRTIPDSFLSVLSIGPVAAGDYKDVGRKSKFRSFTVHPESILSTSRSVGDKMSSHFRNSFTTAASNSPSEGLSSWRVDYADCWEDGTGVHDLSEEWIDPYDMYYAYESVDSFKPNSSQNYQAKDTCDPRFNDNHYEKDDNNGENPHSESKSSFRGRFVALAAIGLCVDDFDDRLLLAEDTENESSKSSSDSIEAWTDISSFSSPEGSSVTFSSRDEILKQMAIKKDPVFLVHHKNLASYRERSNALIRHFESVVSDDGRLVINAHDLKSPQDWIILKEFLSKTDFVDAIRFQGIKFRHPESIESLQIILRRLKSIAFVDTSLGQNVTLLGVIVQTLLQNKQLESASFVRNSLGDGDMYVIGKLLTHPNLLRLSLSWNGIRRAGIMKLCNILLTTKCSVNVLDLSHNFHDDETAKLVFAVRTQYNRQIEILTEQFHSDSKVDRLGFAHKHSKYNKNGAPPYTERLSLIYPPFKYLTMLANPAQMNKRLLAYRNFSLTGVRRFDLVPAHTLAMTSRQKI